MSFYKDEPPTFFGDEQQITEQQQQKLSQMLSKAMIEIRYLAWHDCCQQAGDLADAFENLPYLLRVKALSFSVFQRQLEEYEQKYPRRQNIPEIAVLGDYIEMLRLVRLSS
jgi:hypothetical protein